MKRFLTLLLLIIAMTTASAHDFEVSGIYYLINGNNATVTYKGSNYNEYSNEYTGAVNIPSTITYNGTTYSVTTIGGYAFYGCTGMTSVTIPNSVTSIGGWAFYGCTGLTSVTIPNLVTTISNYAFSHCSGLASMTIPNSVTRIGDSAFSGCTGLTSVTIPNSVVTIGSSAFSGCTGLTSIVVESGNTKYDSRNNCNAIIETASNTLISGCKNTVIPNSVTRIGDSAFSGCTGLTSVTIPNSVVTIGSYAFRDCSGLTSVTIPNSVTTIGDIAFSGCTGLTSVTIPNSVTSIGGLAFYGCTGLTKVNITDLAAWCNIEFDLSQPSNPLFYAHNLYLNGSKVTNLVIPRSVTTIKQFAFSYCSGLTSVNIPNSVTSIGLCAFSYCSGLTSVNIPSSVTSIGGYAFYRCRDLTSINSKIENPSIINMGDNVFEEVNKSRCKLLVPSGTSNLYQQTDQWKDFYNIIGGECLVNGLYYKKNGNSNIVRVVGAADSENIVIPSSVLFDGKLCYVNSIGISAFCGCNGLTSVTIPNSVKTIESYAFYRCSDLSSLTIPNSVTWNSYAFDGCTGLNTLTITGKGEFYNAPYYSQYKTINIGSEITSLYNYSGFRPDLVNCYSEIPPICTSTTFSTYNGQLHVPSASIAAYFTADYWSNFSNLVNDLTEKVTLDKTTAEIVKNETLALTATTQPAGGEVIWCSSNPLIATVDDDGIVSAIGVGQCDVFATLASNAAVYASCHVTVSYPEITLSLNEESLAMNVGEEHTLTATITPNNTGLTPSWSSTNSSVATVNNGVVKAVGEGECDIKVTVLDKIATCHVTVTGNVTIKLNMNNAYVGVNDILTVYPTCTPNLPVDFVVSSSNPSVAIARIVNRTNAPAQSSAPALAETIAIQIIGISNGVATITVASADGKATPATLVVRVGASSTLGDVNGDSNVTAADITELYNHLLGGDTSNNNFLDVNGDGVVTAADVTAVYDVLLGNWQDNPPTLDQQLIGDWVSYQGFNNEYETHYIFNSDYTGSYRFIMNGTVYDDRSFTWSLDGNILSVNSAGNTSTFEIALEDDILHMTANGNTIEFHKVN